MPVILDDRDVDRLLSLQQAIACLDRILRRHVAGDLIAPARWSTSLSAEGHFSVGAGALKGDWAGLRMHYAAAQHQASDELVGVWDSQSARFVGAVYGRRLAQIRSAAFAAIAARLLANPLCPKIGVIGTGGQARAHLEGCAEVLPIRDIVVFSRSNENRASFANEMSERLGLTVRAADNPEEVVRHSGMLIVATSSPEPVFEIDWLPEGIHVSAAGPKTTLAHELPRELVARCDVIAVESIEQMYAYPAPFFSEGLGDVVTLGHILDTTPVPRRRQANSLFCSTGLSGAEAALASEILALNAGL